jgi:single-strand DNA-binding protein
LGQEGILNCCNFVGSLSRNPRLNWTKAGVAVVNFELDVDDAYVFCEAWDTAATYIAKNFKEGDNILASCVAKNRPPRAGDPDTEYRDVSFRTNCFFFCQTERGNTLNQCNFVGRLTRDPELRTTSTDKQVCNFGLAINKKVKGRDETLFIEIDAWEGAAAMIAEHFKKGDPIYVSTQARLDEWEDSDGAKRQKMRFTVREWGFLPSSNKKAEGATTKTVKARNDEEPVAVGVGEEEILF